VTAAPTGSFSGCVVTYRQAHRLYTQTFHCLDIAHPSSSGSAIG
jgi:hypothetical protein